MRPPQSPLWQPALPPPAAPGTDVSHGSISEEQMTATSQQSKCWPCCSLGSWSWPGMELGDSFYRSKANRNVLITQAPWQAAPRLWQVRAYSPELLELRCKRGFAVEVAKVQKALKKMGSESEEHCVWSKERKGGDMGKQSLRELPSSCPDLREEPLCVCGERDGDVCMRLGFSCSEIMGQSREKDVWGNSPRNTF